MTERRWLLIPLLVVVAVLVAACSPLLPDSTGGAVGYTNIGPNELAEMLEDKDFVLVNTHVPYQGEIPQTDLFIPFDEMTDHLDKLPDKDERIVLYCRSGGMSTTAAEVLAAQGYTNVFELDGGMRAWEAAGYDLIME